MDSFITEQKSWSRDDVARMLTSSTALTELDLEAARSVVRLMKAVRFKAKAVILQEGVARSGFMMLVLRGEVVVEQQSTKKSDSLVLGVVGPGGLLGEMSLLDGEPRSATCTAFTEVDAAVLERDALATMMDSHPRECAKLLAVLLKRMSSRLRVANRKMKSLSTQNQRLSTALEAHNQLGNSTPPAASVTAPHVSDDGGMIIL